MQLDGLIVIYYTGRHVNRLRGSNQSRLVPVKDRNVATISDKERVKER